MPTPRFPLYVVTKGRAESRLTSKALTRMGVPHNLVVEPDEVDTYRAVASDLATVVELDMSYKADYATCDDDTDNPRVGPGAARNFVWEHSLANGHDWHWVMDDNIRRFMRLNRNRKIPLGDGTGFHAMETFVLRYSNIGMAGPNYSMFAKRKQKLPPFITNTRIYSCNLIRNDLPYRWRGRYNEDTILSLDMLKARWTTVQFNAFLQEKQNTQTMTGGNTAEFYAAEGTLPKSRMLVDVHPDCSRLMWRFGREHHYVDYRRFRHIALQRHADAHIPDGDPYHMTVRSRT